MECIVCGKGSLGVKHKMGIKQRWVVNNLIYIMLVVIICVAIFSVGMMNYYYMNIRSNLTNSVTLSAEYFSYGLTSSMDSFYASAKRQLKLAPDMADVERQILYTNGRIMLSSSGLPAGMIPGTSDVDEAISQNKTRTYTGRDPQTGERIMSVSSPITSGENGVVGVVRYVTSLHGVDRRIIVQTAIALIVGALIIFFVLISNRYFIRSLLNPLREITEITKQITEGRYGVKIEKKFPDEIGELCDSINEMSEEIARSEKIKNEFISSVSHELRTPLTAIIGWGETLATVGTENREEAKRGIEIMLKETRRLSKMVEELLDFARIESGRFTLYIDRVNLKAEFEETLFMYADMFRKEGLEMTYEQDDSDIFISGDRERLKQVFFNILDNAIKHGKSGGSIQIRAFSEGKTAKIVIRDFGEGISEEELPYVKIKFYKGKSKAQGSGIGLAVSDEIVKLHNGSLDIESKSGEGTTVTISLPIKEFAPE